MTIEACRINSLGQIICTTGTSGDQTGSGDLATALAGLGVSPAKSALILRLTKIVMASNLADHDITNRTDNTASTVELCLDPAGFPDVIYVDLATALRFAPLRLAADGEWDKLCRLLKGIGTTC